MLGGNFIPNQDCHVENKTNKTKSENFKIGKSSKLEIFKIGKSQKRNEEEWDQNSSK